MTFAPRPANIFHAFIDTYFEECARACPRIEAIAGKWAFEDLIPGLSDFDTRFLCSDETTDDDFCGMSAAVGRVHLRLCREHPEWARLLEHLPGVNPLWRELADEASYYPEYRQWTFYRSVAPARLEAAEQALAARAWDAKDEYYFLKKFYLYYQPYDRGIDPAINLGAFESKYPLHSRVMHYFNPPLQAALSVALRRPVRGKAESFRLAREVFPRVGIVAELVDIIEAHYEKPTLYEESALSDFEARLAKGLDQVYEALVPSIRLLPRSLLGDRGACRRALADVPVSPLMKVLDSSRFCRLFKGRMYFYANAPSTFATGWLIHNELGRVADMFVRTPCRVAWKLYAGASGAGVTDAVEILGRLVPDVLSASQAAASREFLRLAPGTWVEGTERQTCLSLMDVFDEVFKGLNSIRRFVEKSAGGA